MRDGAKSRSDRSRTHVCTHTHTRPSTAGPQLSQLRISPLPVTSCQGAIQTTGVSDPLHSWASVFPSVKGGSGSYEIRGSCRRGGMPCDVPFRDSPGPQHTVWVPLWNRVPAQRCSSVAGPSADTSSRKPSPTSSWACTLCWPLLPTPITLTLLEVRDQVFPLWLHLSHCLSASLPILERTEPFLPQGLGTCPSLPLFPSIQPGSLLPTTHPH